MKKKWFQVLLISATCGFVCFCEGYRRGCSDTIAIVEDRADKLVRTVEKRLFGE